MNMAKYMESWPHPPQLLEKIFVTESSSINMEARWHMNNEYICVVRDFVCPLVFVRKILEGPSAGCRCPRASESFQRATIGGQSFCRVVLKVPDIIPSNIGLVFRVEGEIMISYGNDLVGMAQALEPLHRSFDFLNASRLRQVAGVDE